MPLMRILDFIGYLPLGDRRQALNPGFHPTIDLSTNLSLFSSCFDYAQLPTIDRAYPLLPFFQYEAGFARERLLGLRKN